MSPEEFLAAVRPFVPSILGIGAILAALLTVDWIVRQRNRVKASQDHLRQQLLQISLWAAGLVAMILVLPVSEGTRNQLLALFGILVSAAIGLSSTTFVGNAMAGLMLTGLRNFKPGDFIFVGEYFGRISDRGLFTTEIQTEDRDLTTLPNLFLVTNPVRVVRSSGTVVSATVSLGYELSRTRIEARLLEAAADAGLSEGFVQVRDLGDYSVTYRIAGVLGEVKSLISTRSALRKAMLDRLQDDAIEIVSPAFVNKRLLGAADRFVPDRSDRHELPLETAMEAVVFDKADLAASLERLQQRHQELEAEMGSLQAKLTVEEDPQVIQRLERRIARKGMILDAAQEAIEDHEKQKAEE